MIGLPKHPIARHVKSLLHGVKRITRARQNCVLKQRVEFLGHLQGFRRDNHRMAPRDDVLERHAI